MSLISKKDEAILEPLFEELAKKASASIDIKFDKFKLKEFAFFFARKELLLRHPDWENGLQIGAIRRQCAINLVIDLDRISDVLIQEFSIFLKQEIEEQAAKAEKQTESIPQEIFSIRPREKLVLKQVDQKVARGGMTLLHIAADTGNFQEVKRLVEKEGANVYVRDNSNMTPWDRANLRDFTEIANYLANF